MKIKITLLAIAFSIACISNANGQSRSFNKFYNQYKWSENSVKLTVPGVFIKLGARIAKNNVEDEVERNAIKHIKHIKKVKVLVLEGDLAQNVEKAEVKKLISGIEKEKYETLVSVREGGETIKLYVKMKKDCVRNLIVIVDDSEEFVAVNLKTKLKMSELQEILKTSDFGIEM